MRRWVIAMAAMLLMPWMVSLVWMRAAGMETGMEMGIEAGMEGQAGEQEGSDGAEGMEDGEVEAAAGVAEGDPGSQPQGSGELVRRKILVERKGVQTYIDLEEYLPGVMACQVDTDYEMEALKCQAVIARTYIYRLMDSRTEIYEEELDLDYLGEAKGHFGVEREKLFHGLKRCREAAEATKGVVMKYEGRCILPLFHGMSAGRTRNGEADFPYLQSVESVSDTRQEDYMQVMEWSLSVFAANISQIPGAAAVTAEQLPGQIQTVKKDDAGYMVEVKIGEGTYSGDEIQYALGLLSPCFSLEGDNEAIRARVRGKGHGYGLSQAGANDMAKSGWGYEDILKHYYKNISLISE